MYSTSSYCPDINFRFSFFSSATAARAPLSSPCPCPPPRMAATRVQYVLLALAAVPLVGSLLLDAPSACEARYKPADPNLRLIGRWRQNQDPSGSFSFDHPGTELRFTVANTEQIVLEMSQVHPPSTKYSGLVRAWHSCLPTLHACVCSCTAFLVLTSCRVPAVQVSTRLLCRARGRCRGSWVCECHLQHGPV